MRLVRSITSKMQIVVSQVPFDVPAEFFKGRQLLLELGERASNEAMSCTLLEQSVFVNMLVVKLLPVMCQ